MASDHELLLKRSRELILTAKITVSESGETIRRAQQLITAMKLSKVRATPSDAYSRSCLGQTPLFSYTAAIE
jgi:hypothetical protein